MAEHLWMLNHYYIISETYFKVEISIFSHYSLIQSCHFIYSVFFTAEASFGIFDDV